MFGRYSIVYAIFLISSVPNTVSNAKSFVPSDTEQTQIKLDLDKFRNASEIIRSRGFDAREYNVITGDGYILTIQRIINPLVRHEFRLKMKPIIMAHSLLTSSIDWIIDSPNVVPEAWPKTGNFSKRKPNIDFKLNENSIDTQENPNSLGFYMANRGYDVWLSNLRCNLYGQKHVNLTTRDPKFWDFSLDELIAFDLPDTIDFVRKYTKKSKIGFVGHSQGNQIMFGLLSSRPEYAAIIEPFVALAPVAFTKHIKSPIRLFTGFEPILRHINSPFFLGESLIRYIAPRICEPKFMREQFCHNTVFLLCGFNSFELNLERSTAFLAHVPSGASMKQVNHYLQLTKSGRFAHYDYGRLINKKIYNSYEPPDYNLASIKSNSIALFTSANDWLAQPGDVTSLLGSISVKPYAIFDISKIEPRWNHLDFTHSIYSGQIINPRVEEVFWTFDHDAAQSYRRDNNLHYVE